MNYKPLIVIIVFLLIAISPVSAIWEWAGRGNTNAAITDDGTIVFGSGILTGVVRTNETWMSPGGSDGGRWFLANATPSWTARLGATWSYDGGSYVAMIGGDDGIGTGGYFLKNETWVSADYGKTWGLQPVPPWRGRSYAVVNYLAGGYLFVMSGWENMGGVGYYGNDSWYSLNGGASWTDSCTGNCAWEGREYAFGASNKYSTTQYIMGGYNSSAGYLNDVWEQPALGAWTKRKSNGDGTGWLQRVRAWSILANDGSIVMGMGINGAVVLGDVWRSTNNGTTWTQQTSNFGGVARYSPWAVYDTTNNMIIVGGGTGSGSQLQDVWYSTDLGVTWKPYYLVGYNTPGTYTFTTPSFSSIPGVSWNTAIAGGGGGGMGSTNISPWGYQSGSGGFGGSYGNNTAITLTAGSALPITVGSGGAVSGYSTGVSYPGSLSSAFNIVKQPGLGGTLNGISSVDGSGNGYGGLGVTTNYLNTTYFFATNASGVNFGMAGKGYGAGGGGAGNSGVTPHSAYNSGAGAQGVIWIWTDGSNGESTPKFSTTTTTSTIGTVINFTDQSAVRMPGGLSYYWDYGDGITSTTIGNTTHAYGYAGTFTVKLRIQTVAGDLENIKENYITITGSNSQTWYSPSQVRFTVLDYLGNNVIGARVNATYVASTMPDAITWLQNVYGVNSNIASQMLSTNIIMSGLTGDDGAVVFTMHSSLQYNVTANNSFGFISTKIYPKESDYNIWLPAIPSNNTYAQIGYNLTFWEPNASYYTMGATYQDNSSQTMRVTFYVNATNGTSINYTTMTNPGSNLLNITKTIPNTRGDAFYWGLNVVRSTPDMSGKGNISASRGVTSKGASGVMVDLRLPAATYYPWIALFLMFLITSLASKGNVRFMAIIIPIMGAFFWWFGWLQGIYLTTVIPFACILGAIFYMKGSLRENYGVGGSGSMLVNIVVFLIILQMMIGFINGLGIFQQSAIMNPSNEFTNVGLTTIQNTTSNFGGINDPLQSANAYASIGWATFKILLMMIGAVFVVAPFLIEMFPYVPATFFLILQAGIWIIYVLFIAKAAGKLGSEVDF